MSPAYQQGAALSQSLDNKGRRSTIAQAGVFPLTRATSAGVCRCDLPPRHLSSSSLVVGKFSPKERSVHHGFLPSISHWLLRLPAPTPSSYGPPPRPRAKQNKTKQNPHSLRYSLGSVRLLLRLLVLAGGERDCRDTLSSSCEQPAWIARR